MSFSEKIVMMTPELAKEYLQKNLEINRKVSETYVKKYALDMKEGRWQADACPPIIVSRQGHLLDGQHRLLAVVDSGISVEMSVREGVEDTIFASIDQGNTRKASQMVNMKYAHDSEAIAKVIYAFEKGASIRTALMGKINEKNLSISLQNSVLIPFMNENSDRLLKYATIGNRINTAIGRGGVARYGKFAYFCDFLGKLDTFEEFVDDMEQLIPKTKTAALCKERIKTQCMIARYPTEEFVYGVLWQTFRAYDEGREITKIHNISKIYKDFLDVLDNARSEAIA